MGIFDEAFKELEGGMIKEIIENKFNEIENGMVKEMDGYLKEYEINRKRPSIETLPFQPLPRSKAEDLKKAKVGLFGGGTRKKLIAGIEEGRTCYAEVLVIARANKIVDRSEVDPRNNIWRYHYKVADLNGVVMNEDVTMMDERYDISFKYNSGDSASETDCSDVVDPSAYQHMFILYYYLKDDQYCVLITKEQMEDLSVLVKWAGDRFHFTNDGVGYWW